MDLVKKEPLSHVFSSVGHKDIYDLRSKIYNEHIKYISLVLSFRLGIEDRFSINGLPE